MKKSQLFFVIYATANVGLILYGLLAVINPSVLLESFSEHIYRFPAEATRATAYLAALFRLIGYFNLVLGALGLLILHRYRVTVHEWALKIVIASTSLAYIGPIVFDNTVGSIGVFEVVEHILFGLVVIFGLLKWKSQEAL